MATLELGSLQDHLDSDQLRALRTALSDAGAPALPADDHADSVVVERDLDDDIVNDFFDRLEANDASAEVYLPIDFEDIIEVGDMRVGSSHALITVLEGLREDFFIDSSDDEDEDDDEDFDDEALDDDDDDLFASDDEDTDIGDERLQRVWHAMNKGARSSVRKNVALFVRA